MNEQPVIAYLVDVLIVDVLIVDLDVEQPVHGRDRLDRRHLHGLPKITRFLC